MPFTYFIADLHLTADRPDIAECLFRFLQEDAHGADALYVLGDLFEVWIGDDNVTPFNDAVAEAFHHVSKSIPVYFIHGNRDFAIRQKWADKAGMVILKEQTVVDLYGVATLITHGDELCTRDLAYQKFRKKSRSWWWPRLMLAMPLWFRRRVAENGRKESRETQKHLQQEIMDVTPSEVIKAMARHDVTRLIHGHTHRPAIHNISVNNQPAQRIVLGDWYEQGSVLKITPDTIDLQTRHFL